MSAVVIAWRCRSLRIGIVSTVTHCLEGNMAKKAKKAKKVKKAKKKAAKKK